MENKRKHLEFIQANISRMADHSFLLKGWAVTLVAALFALAAKDTNKAYIVIAYVPVLAFWLLDGYFLWQERLFRALYNETRAKKEGEIDFSLDAKKFRDGKTTWPRAVYSQTLLIFYPFLLILILIVKYFL